MTDDIDDEQENTSTEVRLPAEKRCCWCGELIRAGATCIETEGEWEGEPFIQWAHLVCSHAANRRDRSMYGRKCSYVDEVVQFGLHDDYAFQEDVLGLPLIKGVK